MTACAKPMWSKRLWSALQKRKWRASSSPAESGAAGEAEPAALPQHPHAGHVAPRSSGCARGGGNSPPHARARSSSSTCAQSAWARRSIFGSTPSYRCGSGGLERCSAVAPDRRGKLDACCRRRGGGTVSPESLELLRVSGHPVSKPIISPTTWIALAAARLRSASGHLPGRIGRFSAPMICKPAYGIRRRRDCRSRSSAASSARRQSPNAG